MLPTIVRSTEEMLRLVPDPLREGAYALGVPKWKTILKVVLPTALPGIVTGVMLAVARAAGETAPVLLLRRRPLADQLRPVRRRRAVRARCRSTSTSRPAAAPKFAPPTAPGRPR